MTEMIKSEVISRRRVFSLLGLAIARPCGDDSGLAAGDTGRRGVKR